MFPLAGYAGLQRRTGDHLTAGLLIGYSEAGKGLDSSRAGAKLPPKQSSSAERNVALIASPCLGICIYDESESYCTGCGRSSQEITDWGRLDTGARDRVWRDLPARTAAMGITVRRQPWELEEIRDVVVATFADPSQGAWAVGCFGAVAELGARNGAEFSVAVESGQVVARTEGAVARFELTDRIRALTVSDVRDHRLLTHTILTVARVRLPAAADTGLRDLGPDLLAIDAENTEQTLFDLGLGRPGMRFMVRTDDQTLIKMLRSLQGADVTELVEAAGAALMEARPTRVVETPVARAEVSAPIPLPGSSSPSGPHTHLIPDALAQARETPPGLDLPDAFAPGAMFHHAPVRKS